MPKKISKKEKPEVHQDLKGFEIKINAFGEMETNFSIDKLNKFLDDKKKEEEEKDK